MQRSTLVLVQVAAAALLVLGAGLLVAGQQARAGYDCESGYTYEPTPIPADEVDGEAVAFEDLGDEQRTVFLAGFENPDNGTPRTDEQAPAVVGYDGEFYEVGTLAFTCDRPPGTVPTLVGGPLVVVGALGFLPSFAVLRLRDFEG